MAKAIYIQDDDCIDYTPNSDLVAGDVVDLGNFVGITNHDIPNGTLGSLRLEGVYDVVKTTDTIAIGDKIYWVVSSQFATKTSAGSDAVMGYAVLPAASGDATVRVRLTPGVG